MKKKGLRVFARGTFLPIPGMETQKEMETITNPLLREMTTDQDYNDNLCNRKL